jgi:hypothetical protein
MSASGSGMEWIGAGMTQVNAQKAHHQGFARMTSCT